MCDCELFERSLEIVVAVVQRKSHREMSLGQIGLQLQCPLRQRAGFFAALGSALESMDDPTFQLRIARNSEGKFRIELDGPRIKLFGLLQFLQILNALEKKCVGLQKREIGLAVLGWLALHLRLFRRRKSCLQRARNFAGEIGLNRENIS